MTIQLTLTLKRVGEGGGGVVNLNPAVVFPKQDVREQGGVHKI